MNLRPFTPPLNNIEPIDAASPIQIVLTGLFSIFIVSYITIPLVSPTTFFLGVTQLLGAFRIFTEPFIISANTQGQIPTASASLVTYIYQNAFDFQRMGKAAAISWVLFIIVFIVTIIQTVLQRRWVYYETE